MGRPAVGPSDVAFVDSERGMTTAGDPPTRGLRAYFALVFAISTPFWALGAVSSARLTQNLSLGSLMIVAPLAAAVILTGRDEGRHGVKSLLRRAVDVKSVRPRSWFVPIFLLMPALMVVEYGLLFVAGVPVPDPAFTLVGVFAGFGLYFVAAYFEEVGWSGYAIDRLEARYNALAAAVTLGVVWGVWHLPAILEMPGRHTPDWIFWQCANQVVARIVIVWIYNNAGRSVLAAVLFHAVMNVSTQVLMPVDGSFYDPFLTDVLLAIVVVLIVATYGSRTLARGSFGRARNSVASI